MSKLDLVSRVPPTYEKQIFADIIRAICGQVNPLSEGRIAARYNAASAAPTASVAYAVGDFVPDLNCTVTNGSVRLGWVCTVAGTPGTFQEFRGLVANFGQITATLGANVALNNVANYFDGPSIAQGTAGTWFVSGTVSCGGGTTATGMQAKLWDGTTVIDSTSQLMAIGGNVVSISLSGYIASPAGNLRISVKDATNTNGFIYANTTGNSKDSTITAIRIG